MINRELYIPQLAKIISARDESSMVKTFRLKAFEDFRPGQFFQVSLLGVGEAPISISSSPTKKEFLELTIRNTGRLTNSIHNLKKGDYMGLRGPYGNAFPLDRMKNNNLIFAAGGIGLAPLRSMIEYALERRRDYGHIYLLYGAKTQEEMIFKDDLKKWRSLKDFDLFLTIDKAQRGWKGNVGVVTTLFDKLGSDLKTYVAVVCGPPIMIRYTIQRLLEFKVAIKDIFVSLERHMKCGVGKCGHCYMVNKYVCIDGPVFSYKDLKGLRAVEPLFV